MLTNRWYKTTLGEFVSLQRGHDLPEVERGNGSVPIMGSFGGITGYHDVAKAKGPGVTVERSGASFGVVGYSKVDYWPLNTVLYVTDFHENDPRFTYYFFKTFDFTRYNSGSAQPSLNRNYIANIEIKVPTPDEQRAIAHILGTLDDKIELNRRMNETLEETARAFFKSWFVDFDPVRAKMAGRQPEGMDAETAALFPDGLEGSELGEIPQGWRVAELDTIIDVNPKRSLLKGVEAPYLDMGSMPTQGARALDWYSRIFSSGSKFINGDVLLARITPCLENGKTAFVDFLENQEIGWGSTEYIVLRSKHDLPLEYAYFLARSEEFRAMSIQSMTGSSGRQRVPVDAVKRYRLVVPNGFITKKFGDFVASALKGMKSNDAESRTLAALRDTLLPKLLSGNLRVPEAESVVETVL